MLGEAGEDAQLDVGGRAHVQRHPLARQPLDQRRVLDGAGTVVDAPHAEQVDHVAHPVRPGRLAGVCGHAEPELGRLTVGAGELPAVQPGRLLVAVQAEADHTRRCVAAEPVHQLLGPFASLVAADGGDQPAVGVAVVRRPVEAGADGGDQVAVADVRPVARAGHHLGVDDAVAGHPRGVAVGDLLGDLGSAEEVAPPLTRAQQVVQAGVRVEPVDRPWHRLAERGGELRDRLRLDAGLEVDVDLDLGQRADLVEHGRSRVATALAHVRC